MKKNSTRLILLFILIFLLGGTAVGLTDIGKLCIFSAISGVITKDGKPVAHAKVIRTGKKERSHQDETTTDDKGYFSFPPMYERSIAKFLPMEFVAKQNITVEYQGHTYKLWSGSKGNPDENAEARGKLLKVDCDLNNEINHIWVNGSVFSTKCKWDVEPDPPFDMNKAFDSDLGN